MAEFVTVDLLQGQLRGKRVVSSDTTYYSFQGIPYAKPPVGALRFKPPEEPEPWTGVRDATVEGSVAPQISHSSGQPIGDEDCLFLNVYTPQWKVTSPLKAVMFWIHGGAYCEGSGNSEEYGPEYLVAEDLVLVTLNYRLGALGFLYIQGTDATGNNALRDQVMALKWVKRNIARFGGDPDNVTISGSSAGSLSVYCHMLSPLADGLFHRAIAQSCTVLANGIELPLEVSSHRARHLAQLTGCTSADPQQVVDFLRTVPADQLVAHQLETATTGPDELLLAPFLPTEEVGPLRFLPAAPEVLLEEGRFRKVPCLSGITSSEGQVIFCGKFGDVSLSRVDENFECMLPQRLARKHGKDKRKQIAKELKKFYFGEKPVCRETHAQFVDLCSDLLFTYPLVQTVRLQLEWSQCPIYVYLFDHVSSTTCDGELPESTSRVTGVPHAGEVPFLFKNVSKTVHFPPGSPDHKVQSELVKMWASFANTGNPSLCEMEILWTPATKERFNYMRIRDGFSMETDLHKTRMDFLDYLYNKYG